MRSVRLNFSKSGRAIYISHLDVNRMMSRAVRRARLPMWYTEGFNPHPYISFALPLSLGMESDCEFMDIRVEGDITDGEIAERLNAVLPEGIRILSAAEPVFNSNLIESAKYFIKLTFESEGDASNFAADSEALLEKDEIIAEKPGKKGHRKVMKQVNLKGFIYDIKLTQAGDVVNIQAVLAAGNTNNLNPNLLIEALEKHTGVYHKYIAVARKKLITSEGKEFK